MQKKIIIISIAFIFGIISLMFLNKTYALDSTYKGYDVVGRLEIPRLNVDLPILSEATDESMDASVGLYQGSIGQIGVVAIKGYLNSVNETYTNPDYPYLSAGLSLDDIIKVTDMEGNVVTYKVYWSVSAGIENMKAEELTRDTGGKREITLIAVPNENPYHYFVKDIVHAIEVEEESTNNETETNIVTNTETENETETNTNTNTNINTNISTENNTIITNDIDDTVSKDVIPQAGEKSIVIIVITLLSIIGTISYIKFKKYKKIK